MAKPLAMPPRLIFMPALSRKTVSRLLVADDVAVVDELASLGDFFRARGVRIGVLIEPPEPVHRLEGDVEHAARLFADPEAFVDDARRLGADLDRRSCRRSG